MLKQPCSGEHMLYSAIVGQGLKAHCLDATSLQKDALCRIDVFGFIRHLALGLM